MKLTTMLVLAFLVGLLAGCKTYITDNYTRTIYREDGKTVERIEQGVLSTEQGPLTNKAVRAEGSFLGAEITMTDPQTGNPMPCLKLLNGSASAGTIPVTSGKASTVETFGTYREVFRYDTSAWPWVSKIATMSYDRVSGGAGVSSQPSVRVVIEVPVNGEEPVAAIEEAKPAEPAEPIK